jgi:hypothetical protein
MENFARIVDNVAVDVSTNPAGEFHPDIAILFVQVPDQVQPQWQLVDGVWFAPVETDTGAPIETAQKQPSPVEFKLLFTAAERVAIKTSTDPIVQDFYEIVNDPRLTFVNRALKTTQDALHYLEASALIGPGRADEILTAEIL